MTEPDFEVVVIGAGPGGIAAAHLLQRKGIEDFVIVERGYDFGGTWRDNHYPGALPTDSLAAPNLISDIVLWLASDASSLVTAAQIPADKGYLKV